MKGLIKGLIIIFVILLIGQEGQAQNIDLAIPLQHNTQKQWHVNTDATGKVYYSSSDHDPFHKGNALDFGVQDTKPKPGRLNPHDIKVVAAEGGKIIEATPNKLYNGMNQGGVVKIEHKNGIVTTYAHINIDAGISVGSEIKRGARIGVIADEKDIGEKSEVWNGPHLHFSVNKPQEVTLEDKKLEDYTVGQFYASKLDEKKMEIMIPIAKQIPPHQIDFNVQNAVQNFQQLAKPFQPITEPFVQFVKSTAPSDASKFDASRNAQRTAGDIPVTVTFTQELSGLYTQTPDYFLAPGANWSIGNISGTRTGEGSIPGNFTTGSGSGRLETTRSGYVAATLSNAPFTIETEGTVSVSGKAGQPLTGTMTSTFNTTSIENVSLTGDVKIYLNGRLDWTNIRGDVTHSGVGKTGEVQNGTINQGPTR